MKFLYVLLIGVIGCSAADQLQIRWSSAERQGDRDTMEDKRVCTFPFRNDNQRAFFGIFDGHGGSAFAAEYAALNIEKLLKVQDDNNNPLQPNWKDAFLKLDKKIEHTSGTCALAAYIFKHELHLAWLGDSRAVFGRGRTLLFETADHTTSNQLEADRVKASGGAISFATDARRVNGWIMVTRALGNGGKNKRGMTAVPEFEFKTVNPGDTLILGCDGIWDVLSSQRALDLVDELKAKSIKELKDLYPDNPKSRNPKDSLAEEGNDDHLKLIARGLREEAYNLESSDNLSVTVIEFQ